MTKDTTEWFADAGWGVLCHWLAAPPSSAGGAEISAAAWNRQVDAFPDELVVGYTKHVTSRGGVITWDAPIERSGLIPDVYVKQLTAIGKAMSKP